MHSDMGGDLPADRYQHEDARIDFGRFALSAQIGRRQLIYFLSGSNVVTKPIQIQVSKQDFRKIRQVELEEQPLLEDEVRMWRLTSLL